MAVDINGDGLIGLGGTSTTQGRLRLSEDTDNGTNYVELQAPANIASNFTLTLPSADGTSGQALVTNGSGALSFGSAGFNGATINAVSSSALTLTSASTQYQKVQSTSTTNNIVNLPSATTLATKGAYPFVIENRGLRNQSLIIRNNGGITVGSVSIGGVSSCALVDNSTANGIWSLSSDTVDQTVVANETSLTNTTLAVASSMQGARVIGLTATKFIMYYATASAGVLTLRILVGDISGSTITYGAEQTTTYTLSSSANVNYASINCYRLSDTAFVVLAGAGGFFTSGCIDTYHSLINVRTCTVSGTTVTFGATSALSFPIANGQTATPGDRVAKGSIYNGDVVRMSDTKYAVIYNTGQNTLTATDYPTNYNGSLGCNIITVSGTTQTIGTRVDLGTSTFTQVLGLGCYDTDKLLVCYGQGTQGSTTGRSKLVVITVSGTVPTWGTPVNIQSSDSACQTTGTTKGIIFPVSTSKCFVPYIDNTTTNAALVSISVTTPSVDFTSSAYYSVWANSTIVVSSSLLYGNNRFTYVTTDGFYVVVADRVGNVQTGFTASLPSSGSTNLVTVNGAGGSQVLTTALATAAFNS